LVTGSIENQIAEWVRRQVIHVDKAKGRCRKMVVRHVSLDNKVQGDVHTCNIPSDPGLDGIEVADRVASEIAEHAQDDANSQASGIQKYVVMAYFDGDDKYCPRRIFRVMAEEESSGDLSPSEPPTERGVAAMLMRHLERERQVGSVTIGFMFQTLQKEIADQRAVNKTFLQQQVDLMLLVREVLDDGHKRKIEERKLEIETALVEGAFEHLKHFLPIILNRVAGKEIIPATMDKQFYMLASLFEGLEPEQQEAIRKMLKPQQLALLAEILGSYEQKKESFLRREGGGDGSPGGNPLVKMFEPPSSPARTGDGSQDRDKKISDRARALTSGLEKLSKHLSEE